METWAEAIVVHKIKQLTIDSIFFILNGYMINNYFNSLIFIFLNQTSSHDPEEVYYLLSIAKLGQSFIFAIAD